MQARSSPRARINRTALATLGVVALTVPPALASVLAIVSSAVIAGWAGSVTCLAIAIAWLVVALRSFTTGVFAIAPYAGGWLAIAIVVPTYIPFTFMPAVRELSSDWAFIDVAGADGVQADRVALGDGEVRLDLMLSTNFRRRKTITLVPVVGPSWTPADPITAWIFCMRPDYEPARMCTDLFDARPLRGRNATDNGYARRAAREAESTHGLRSSSGALLLRLMPRARGEAWADLAGFALVWLIAGAGVIFMTQRRFATELDQDT